jgi:hypothetical protein
VANALGGGNDFTDGAWNNVNVTVEPGFVDDAYGGLAAQTCHFTLSGTAYLYQIFFSPLGSQPIQLGLETRWSGLAPGIDTVNFGVARYDGSAVLIDSIISTISITHDGHPLGQVGDWHFHFVEDQFLAPAPTEVFYVVAIDLSTVPSGVDLRMPFFRVAETTKCSFDPAARPADVVSQDFAQSLRGDMGALEFDFIPLHEPDDGLDHRYVSITPINGASGYIRFWHEGASNKLALTINDGVTTSTILTTVPSSLSSLSRHRIRIVWQLGTCWIYQDGVVVASGICTAVGTNPIPVASRIVLGDGTAEGWFIPKEFAGWSVAKTTP